MAIRRGLVLGLQYHPVRPPGPPASALLYSRRPLATRLRLRAAVPVPAPSVRQVRRPTIVTSCRTASPPRQGKRVAPAVCKLPRFHLGRTRVHCCARRSRRQTLRSRRVPGRMRRSVDTHFEPHKQECIFPFFPFMYALSTDRSTVDSLWIP